MTIEIQFFWRKNGGDIESHSLMFCQTGHAYREAGTLKKARSMDQGGNGWIYDQSNNLAGNGKPAFVNVPSLSTAKHHTIEWVKWHIRKHMVKDVEKKLAELEDAKHVDFVLVNNYE